MKVKIIFFIFVAMIFWGCKTSEPAVEPLPDQPFDLTVQYWFSNPDSDSNFTEKGIDLIIHINDYDFLRTPDYVIFSERKSFPPMITPAEEDGYQIEARIILESSRLQNTSEKVNQTNRVVFTNDDGDEVYIIFRDWETLPNKYN